jgi:hypothetical protein
MKKHFLSLFDPSHKKWTIFFFSVAFLLIIASAIAGVADNLPGILMLLSGMVFLFFSVLHPWQKVEYYAMLIGSCVGIIFLGFLGIQILVWLKKTEYISEAFVMIVVFLICLPGILAGIIGTLICAFRK